MLQTYPSHDPADRPAYDPDTPHKGATWIDLLNATDEDVRLVQELTGLHVPTRAELDEIESSSRHYRENGAFYLSVPAALSRPDRIAAEVTPVGYVLSRDHLITVRFTELPSFAGYAAGLRRADNQDRTPIEILTGLLESIVDHIADLLELLGRDLDSLSHLIFSVDDEAARRPKKVAAELRQGLRKIGQKGDLLSKLRETMLGIGRLIGYVLTNAGDWVKPAVETRLRTAQQDIHSLAEHDEHLNSKIQFLLDATLGFINIEQNDIIKVLTIVSVVGVPPTLVAGIYGMNFKNMPEYDWAYGYAYGLVVLLVSAVGPYLWFKYKGWL